MKLLIKTEQGTLGVLQPGDIFDFGPGEGRLVYYTAEEAVAMRLLTEIRQKGVREVIEFVKQKYGIKT